MVSEGSVSSRRDERLVRLLCAVGCAAVLGLSFIYSPSHPPTFHVCLFERFTGFPCPGCGLTRAFCALSHGDSVLAWRYHPFVFVFYPAVWLTFLGAVCYPLLPAWLVALARSLAVPFFATLAICMLLFGVARIWYHWPVG